MSLKYKGKVGGGVGAKRIDIVDLDILYKGSPLKRSNEKFYLSNNNNNNILYIYIRAKKTSWPGGRWL